MEKWVKPSWIGEEITKNSEYSNIVLAMQNLKF
jgi:CYTH domain-containing protein